MYRQNYSLIKSGKEEVLVTIFCSCSVWIHPKIVSYIAAVPITFSEWVFL